MTRYFIERKKKYYYKWDNNVMYFYGNRSNYNNRWYMSAGFLSVDELSRYFAGLGDKMEEIDEEEMFAELC